MTENHSTICSATGRVCATVEDARASEGRFQEIQAACEAGGVPELRPGDVIYLESEYFISHGCDDFCGGLAEVAEVSQGKPQGQLVIYVRLVQQPGGLYNWSRLAGQQKELRRLYGANWAHPCPDNRPEHNGYFL